LIVFRLEGKDFAIAVCGDPSRDGKPSMVEELTCATGSQIGG
jgi:hypothetical protein